ncbi:NAD(P)-dependent oxidoreductase [Phaeobacter sp. C3_T13_0]|uniref:NAD(P)-dependent oxidoreductase n=1 Tax=Phaeobacter cretensis TaxID=3342641 RepID=UPI0039BC6363
MKIVLLGANGRTGREVLKLALAAGDKVTALVRDVSKLVDIQDDNLTVHAGDVCDPKTVAALLPSHDVVISTLGPRSPRKAACKIYSQSATSIIAAMERSEVNRLLVISTALLFPPRGLFDRVLGTIAGNNAREAKAMEETIRVSDLNWCIARVGFLNSNPTDVYQFAEGRRARGGNSISRAAVASFLHSEASSARHDQKIVGLCC